jgi:hypothetical protein
LCSLFAPKIRYLECDRGDAPHSLQKALLFTRMNLLYETLSVFKLFQHPQWLSQRGAIYFREDVTAFVIANRRFLSHEAEADFLTSWLTCSNAFVVLYCELLDLQEIFRQMSKEDQRYAGGLTPNKQDWVRFLRTDTG